VENPVFTYKSDGDYYPVVWVHDAAGGNASTSLTVVVGPNITVSASASPTTGKAPLTVAFNGSASGGTAPYTYSWTFADGSFSSAQNPTHIFYSQGTYQVGLTAADPAGNIGQAWVWVNVTSGPGNFTPLALQASASPSAGNAPLLVAFNAIASGGYLPYCWSWVFGDGNHSTLESPSHTYAADGHYLVWVTVTDAGGKNTSQSITIMVGPAIDAAISASPIWGSAPLTVTFTGSGTGGIPPLTYSWTFGDGGFSSSQNPAHTFSSGGLYQVGLVVTDSVENIGQASIWISVNGSASESNSSGSLAGSLSSVPTSGDTPLTVSFASSASGGTAPYSYYWSFGDGSVATAQNVSHTYWGAGTFSVFVEVRDGSGQLAVEYTTITVENRSCGNCSAIPTLNVPTSTGAGQEVTFTASLAGSDSGAYQTAWSFGDGSNLIASLNPHDGSQVTVQHVYRNAGTYHVSVLVIGATTAASSATATLQVQPATHVTSPAKWPTWIVPVAIGIGAVVIVGTTVIVGRRRRPTHHLKTDGDTSPNPTLNPYAEYPRGGGQLGHSRNEPNPVDRESTRPPVGLL
jgi:PKD repeat protein